MEEVKEGGLAEKVCDTGVHSHSLIDLFFSKTATFPEP